MYLELYATDLRPLKSSLDMLVLLNILPFRVKVDDPCQWELGKKDCDSWNNPVRICFITFLCTLKKFFPCPFSASIYKIEAQGSKPGFSPSIVLVSMLELSQRPKLTSVRSIQQCDPARNTLSLRILWHQSHRILWCYYERGFIIALFTQNFDPICPKTCGYKMG